MDILLSRTDENHPMTADALVKVLEEQGITAERKAVYRDIAALQEYGVDIIKSPKKGFFVGSRDFDLAELKLHEAIDQKCQIGFVYYEYGLNKVLIPKRNGERYRVSPYLLHWEGENYYLIAYYPRYESLAHFRVDKMRDIELLPDKAEKCSEKINPSDYAKRTFSMFGGEEMPITMKFRPDLIGVFIDRFGKDITLTKKGDWLKTRVHVRVSPSFFAWVFQLGDGIKLVGPSKIVDEYTEYLKKIISLYL